MSRVLNTRHIETFASEHLSLFKYLTSSIIRPELKCKIEHLVNSTFSQYPRNKRSAVILFLERIRIQYTFSIIFVQLTCFPNTAARYTLPSRGCTCRAEDCFLATSWV